MASNPPLFHLYGDPPDDEVFDFIHVETIESRSSIHDWIIQPHRHRNLSQILLIERGGGEMQFEAQTMSFTAPVAIFVPPIVTHAFRFKPKITNGWVVTFTDDSISVIADRTRKPISPFATLAEQPIIPIGDNKKATSLSYFCSELFEEYSLARQGYELAIHGLLAVIAIRLMRLSARRPAGNAVALYPSDNTVAKLRTLVDTHFREERSIAFYASNLSMTPDRLNDHVKRAIGVTAGHVIRQRILTEAKRQLVFTMDPIKNIAAELAFSDGSHFTRFFGHYVGMTPQEFRFKRGG
jgi:AraC family transcriptional regulator, transcriptional activator of pobA